MLGFIGTTRVVPCYEARLGEAVRHDWSRALLRSMLRFGDGSERGGIGGETGTAGAKARINAGLIGTTEVVPCYEAGWARLFGTIGVVPVTKPVR
jgi:hypothetical protein